MTSSNPASSSPPAPVWLGRLIALGTITLVLAPLLRGNWSKEQARWQAAQVYEHLLEGKADMALAEVEAGLSQWPDASDLLELRMQIHMERGRYEQALSDCDALIAQSARDKLALRLTRSTICQHLHRHTEALADVQLVFETLEQLANRIPDPTPLERFLGTSTAERRNSLVAMAHNARAYAIAVAHWHAGLDGLTSSDSEQLLRALADIERAIAAQKQVSQGDLSPLLDTRGFIYYLLGDLASALDNFEMALVDEQELRPKLLDRLRRSHPDPREAVSEYRRYEQSLDIIHFHQELAFQEIGLIARLLIDQERF